MRAAIVLLFCVSVVVNYPILKKYKIEQLYGNPIVQRFREYIQIDTSKEENIGRAVEFWERQAALVGLDFKVHYPAGKPICVLTWEGADPHLQSIMLNSHMDVVTVEEDTWRYPPFAATVDEDGNIYGRGTQDDKDIAIQYLEAIWRLKNENITLQRTLHMTLMPDEETGGFNGMIPFLETKEFKNMNIGFALDEGLASDDDTLYAMYTDRRPWQMKFSVHGKSAHGSKLTEGTAMEKAQTIISAVMKYREEQKQLIKSGVMAEANSVNINVVSGGQVANIVPSLVTFVVDMRLAPSANATEMQSMVDSWIALGGNGTVLEFLRRVEEATPTSVDETNHYWMALQEAIKDLGMTVQPIVCPATSDMIYARNVGISALGFSAKPYTESRIHSNDEYLNAETLIRGVDIYVEVLKKLGNVSTGVTEKSLD